jgi:hypothetical protein
MKKDRETVIGYTFRVGYIYRADCITIRCTVSYIRDLATYLKFFINFYDLIAAVHLQPLLWIRINNNFFFRIRIRL